MEAGPVHVADLHQIHGGEDGVVDLEDCAVLRSFLQQIAAGAHIHRGVGDDLLADGVHGRVGHLGEELLEVAEQGLVLFRQHRQRCVHAHGGGGLRPIPGHGEDSVLHLLIGVAEGLVQPVPPLLGGPLHTPVGDGKIPQVYQVGIEPLAVGLLAGVPLLDLGVVHQSTGSQVCQQHPPRLEPGLLHDLLRRDVQHPHLGGENQLLVGSEIPPAGAQAVPVQHRAHRVPIGEHDGRRAVPGLHHGGIVVVEVPLLPAHFPVVGPGFRDAHHHRLGQWDVVHHQKFQGVVQHGGVGAALVYHRQDLVHVRLQYGRVHSLLPGQHPVHVAPDGVDFTVMEDVAVGMGPLPAGGGVGGEPGVDQGDGALTIRLRQVRVELPQLPHQEHALVHDGPAGEGANVGVHIGLLELPADHIQLPVKVQATGAVYRPGHKALADAGHTVQGLPAQHLRMGGHIPPAQEVQPLLGRDDLQHLLGLGPLQRVCGEEEHAHAIIPGAAQGDALGGGRLHHQLVWHLNHQPHAVTGLAGGVFTCPVLQLFHDLQGTVHCGVGRRALQIDHGADAAGVVLPQGIIDIVYVLRWSTHWDCLPCRFIVRLQPVVYRSRISRAVSASRSPVSMLYFCRKRWASASLMRFTSISTALARQISRSSSALRWI